MTTKKILSLVGITGMLIPLSMLLSRKTGYEGFILLAALAAFGGIGLMVYAWYREKTIGDKSERVSSRAAVMIFCGITLWIAFVMYRGLAH